MEPIEVHLGRNTVNVSVDENVVNVDLGKVIIRSVSYSEYTLINSEGDLISQGIIESGQTATITAPDAYYYLRNSEGTLSLSGQIPSNTSEYITLSDSYYILKNSDNLFISSGATLYEQTSEITAPDSNYTLINSSGDTLSASTIPSSSSQEIFAPDASYILLNSSGDTLSAGTIPSNLSFDILAPDSSYILLNSSGVTLSANTISSNSSEEITAPNASYTLINSSGDTLSASTIPSSGSQEIFASDASYIIIDGEGSLITSGNTASGRETIIVQSGSSTTGDYLVRFIDFDGTILKSEWVNSGNDATAPTLPTHTNLTFDIWNNVFTNITRNIDVGALYETTDGHSHLFVTLTPVTGYQPTIHLKKLDTQTMTIRWGDGTSQTTAASGVIAITKTAVYASAGDYDISIECDGDYEINNSYILDAGLNYQKSITKFYAGNTCTALGTFAFRSARSLQYVMLHKDCRINTATYGFNVCYSLKALIVPTVETTITTYLLDSCRSLTALVLTENIIYLTGARFVGGARSLHSIVIPQSVISMSGANLMAASGIQKITMPTTATFGTITFSDCDCLEECLIPIGTTYLTATFVRCYAIVHIDVPDTVITVGANTFIYCYSLNDLVFHSVTPPTLANVNAFTGINPTCKIYVPDASVAAYQAATNWTVYSDYIYPLSERP